MIKFKSCNLRVGKDFKPLKDVHIELDVEAIIEGVAKQGREEVAKDIGMMVLEYVEKNDDYDPLEVE